VPDGKVVLYVSEVAPIGLSTVRFRKGENSGLLNLTRAHTTPLDFGEAR